MIGDHIPTPFSLRTSDFSLTNPECPVTRVESSVFGDRILSDSLGNMKGIVDSLGNVRAGRDGCFPVIGRLSGPGIIPLP